MARTSKWAAYVDVEKALKDRGVVFRRTTHGGHPVLAFTIKGAAFPMRLGSPDVMSAYGYDRHWSMTGPMKRVGWPKTDPGKVADSIVRHLDNARKAIANGTELFASYSHGAFPDYSKDAAKRAAVVLSSRTEDKDSRIQLSTLNTELKAKTQTKYSDDRYVQVARDYWDDDLSIADRRKLAEWLMSKGGQYKQYIGHYDTWTMATATRGMSSKLGKVLVKGDRVLTSPEYQDNDNRYHGAHVTFLSLRSGWNTGAPAHFVKRDK